MSDDLLSRISIEPDKCFGRPCIRGMRFRVIDILQMLAGGATQEEILTDFDFLEPDDIKAALAYAALAVDHPRDEFLLEDQERYRQRVDEYITRHRDMLNESIRKGREELAAGNLSVRSMDEVIADGRRRNQKP
jgi:uncharacterized protein (DUF433 family)